MKKLLENLLIPSVVFAMPLAVFLYTLYPSVAPGDSTEMVTAAISLGVPHQPSYPLNTLLGYLASMLPLPFSQVAKVNAASAFLQALTVLVFYFLVLELFRHMKATRLGIWERLAGLAASMFLAFSLIFWEYATKFEVFPLNNLFAVAILLLAAKFALHKKADKPNKKEERMTITLVIGLALLIGLAITHHQTIVLIFPAVIFLIYTRGLDFLAKKSNILVSLLALVLGALPFFILLISIAAKHPVLNWGEITGVDGAFAALFRRDFGTFSSYIVGFQAQARTLYLDEILYYLKYIVFDFSILGVVLIITGLIYLWRREKRLFYFIGIGILVSGFVFLSYAGFPITDTFNQATVRRFMMLPNIFVSLSLAFGFYQILEKFQQIEVTNATQRWGVGFGTAALFLTFAFPLYMNFTKANNRKNLLTYNYTLDSFANTPDNALIMLSGDIPNMTVDFFRLVENKKENQRIIFTPGQFHLSWFIPQLLKKYPNLLIPLPEKGKLFTSATQVVDANYGRWPIYVGPDLVANDPQLEEKYVLYPKNLLFLVKKKGEDIGLEEWREENDRLWDRLDLNLMNRLKKNSPLFEETIIFHYARHFYNVGSVYEDVKLYEDAIREYERTLKIDPYFKEALAALGRIYGEKLSPPDYLKAIEYLRNYQSVLGKDDIELGGAAENMIQEYQQKILEEQQQGVEPDKSGEQTATEEEKLESTTSGQMR